MNEHGIPQDPSARPIFLKRSLIWTLSIFGVGLIIFGVFLRVTEQTPDERVPARGSAALGVVCLALSIYRSRVPSLWIGDSGVRLRGGQRIAWEDIEGITMQAGGGASMALLIPKDPSMVPSLGLLSSLSRRFSSWSIGRPVWGGIQLTALGKGDLEFILELLERKGIAELESKKNWVKRIFWFLGP